MACEEICEQRFEIHFGLTKLSVVSETFYFEGFPW